MCLNMPVVLLCQGTSDPDSNQAVGSWRKILCVEPLQTTSVVLGEVIYRRQVAIANLATLCLFFKPSLFLPNKIVGDWQAVYTLVVENCFSQQNSMPGCFNYYLFKCLMSVLAEGKAEEENHWKRLAKIRE